MIMTLVLSRAPPIIVPSPTNITPNLKRKPTRDEDVEKQANQTHGIILDNRNLEEFHYFLVTEIDFKKQPFINFIDFPK